jgi:hypothetical protein
VIAGAVVSLTVKLVEQVLVFRAASATKMVTEVVPGPTSVPAAGLWDLTSAPAAVQLSTAFTPARKLGTAAWQLAFALTV